MTMTMTMTMTMILTVTASVSQLRSTRNARFLFFVTQPGMYLTSGNAVTSELLLAAVFVYSISSLVWGWDLTG